MVLVMQTLAELWWIFYSSARRSHHMNAKFPLYLRQLSQRSSEKEGRYCGEKSGIFVNNSRTNLLEKWILSEELCKWTEYLWEYLLDQDSHWPTQKLLGLLHREFLSQRTNNFLQELYIRQVLQRLRICLHKYFKNCT